MIGHLPGLGRSSPPAFATTSSTCLSLSIPCMSLASVTSGSTTAICSPSISPGVCGFIPTTRPLSPHRRPCLLPLLLNVRGGASSANSFGTDASEGSNADLTPSTESVTDPAEEVESEETLAQSLKEAIRLENDDITSVYAPSDAEALRNGHEGTEVPQWSIAEEEADGEGEGKEEDEVGAGRPVPMSSLPLTERTAFVIIDPFSPFLGRYLKRRAQAMGLVCIDVLSPYTVASLQDGPRKWRAPWPGAEKKWAAHLPAFKRVAFVLSESDHGVATAERMHAAVGAPGNGVNPTRRNKYLTNQALQARGVGYARQVRR